MNNRTKKFILFGLNSTATTLTSLLLTSNILLLIQFLDKKLRSMIALRGSLKKFIQTLLIYPKNKKSHVLGLIRDTENAIFQTLM